MASNTFRDLLFPLTEPRLVDARGLSASEFGLAARENPILSPLIAEWERRGAEPFKGVSTDGEVETGLFHLADDAAPVDAMVNAAVALLQSLTSDERKALMFDINAPEWRRWSNPEFLLNPNGLRLEDLSAPRRRAVMAVLQASLSTSGYRKAVGCMQTNAFLGRLCAVENIMNEWSYNFLLFGNPSTTEPWGWSLYGHHLAINCFVLGRQMVISPTFMGAEPNMIDTGPHAGLRMFDDEEGGGLALMRSLAPDIQKRAQTYRHLHDPLMPEGRWNFADQRHLGGAFRDNQIIPYEGVPVKSFSHRQKDRLMSVVEAFISYLPAGL